MKINPNVLVLLLFIALCILAVSLFRVPVTDAMTIEESDALYFQRVEAWHNVVQDELKHQRAVEIAEKEMAVLGKLEQLSASNVTVSNSAFAGATAKSRLSNAATVNNRNEVSYE